MTGHHSKKM